MTLCIMTCLSMYNHGSRVVHNHKYTDLALCTTNGQGTQACSTTCIAIWLGYVQEPNLRSSTNKVWQWRIMTHHVRKSLKALIRLVKVFSLPCNQTHFQEHDKTKCNSSTKACSEPIQPVRPSSNETIDQLAQNSTPESRMEIAKSPKQSYFLHRFYYSQSNERLFAQLSIVSLKAAPTRRPLV